VRSPRVLRTVLSPDTMSSELSEDKLGAKGLKPLVNSYTGASDITPKHKLSQKCTFLTVSPVAYTS